MEITDVQIREACTRLGLAPVGRPEVRGYNTDLNLVGSDISSGRFDAFDYDSCCDAIKSHADTLAGVMTGPEALVAIADLGVNETTEGAGHRISDWAEDRVSRTTLDGLAWELLAYAGYQVCLEVFAETLNSKRTGLGCTCTWSPSGPCRAWSRWACGGRHETA